ncbi:hypothetical protein [Xanthomonas euvesicatoria]|uniref:hypothetical protein n=1 Tax=Xanthomonas euvesicatoria TaxID=456327 RepID=UPI001C48398F|nr:hypothetical protein [Xanthomonas euvesicatoria]MBV6884720.1 hypothetical protein [Xanthomonas campestris pv. euphorbiae]
MLLIQFIGRPRAYSSIDVRLSRLRSLAMRAAEPALVGEFPSAKDQGAVASRDPHLCGRGRRAAWRTGDAQSIEPSAGNALARDAL